MVIKQKSKKSVPQVVPPSDKELIKFIFEIQNLLELNGENVFKVRAFKKAHENLSQYCESNQNLIEKIKDGSLLEMPGIGKGIFEALKEFFETGQSKIKDNLVASLPEGLLELTQVSGLGRKRALELIEKLQIRSLVELEYACRENRLIGLMGFGEKVQKKILESVQFMLSSQGFIRLNDALLFSDLFIKKVNDQFKIVIKETGALRRRLEVMSCLEFIVDHQLDVKVKKNILNLSQSLQLELGFQVQVDLHESDKKSYFWDLFLTTGSEKHVCFLKDQKFKKIENKLTQARSENEIYGFAHLAFIAPEFREGQDEIIMAQKSDFNNIVCEKDVRGVFHNHTTYSDGSVSINEMVKAAIDLNYEYIGISDHSQSAFYAQGLKEDQLLKQQQEIIEVQNKYPQIKIFWGIESDILKDGSLDYPEKILKLFDFVIASVHQRHGLDCEAMTKRIIKAIENPYTTMIGHLTGRLLLGRKGYELDVSKILKAASYRGVVIEINANPARLDIDWRYGDLLRENKTLVSINPDAHNVKGLKDTKFGVFVARKAMLPKSQVLNTKSTSEIKSWLA